MPEERDKLQLFTVLPNKFHGEDRLNQTLAADNDFNEDTHENTAYKKVSGKIKDDHKSEHNPTGRVLGGPQIVQVPFKFEETIRHLVDYHRNRAMETAIANHRQY